MVSRKNLTDSDIRRKNYALVTTDVAERKGEPSRKVKARKGEDVLQVWRRFDGYLQVSTGIRRTVRDMLVVDVDTCDCIPYGRVLENIEDICVLLDFPLPSFYQLHLDNGHFQLYWLFKESIRIKGGGEECAKLHEDYKKLLKSAARVMFGDIKYTGWQCKNIFYTDKSKYKTFWNGDTLWCEEEPAHVQRYSFREMFDKLFGSLRSIGDDELAELYSLSNMCGTYQSVSDFKKKLGISNENDADVRSESRKERAKERAEMIKSKSAGRNEYVRMMTYSFVRETVRRGSLNECKSYVYSKLLEFKSDNPKAEPYTDEEFNRDCSMAYNDAVTNFDKNLCGRAYNDKQISNSAEMRAKLKTLNILRMYLLLRGNIRLVPNKSSNNKAVAFALGVDSRSVREYKNEIKIGKHTVSLTRETERAVRVLFDNYFSYCGSLMDAYKNMCEDGYFTLDKYKGKESEWLDRIRKVYDDAVVRMFTENIDIKNADKKRKIQEEWDRLI